jgi:hypothetical protein
LPGKRVKLQLRIQKSPIICQDFSLTRFLSMTNPQTEYIQD